MRLITFYRKHRPRLYGENWHQRLLCTWIERAYRERLNLIIEAPPRHGKSELACMYGPAYGLACDPLQRFLVITNADSLSALFVNATRQIIQSPEYQNDFPLPMGVCRENQFRLTVPGVGKDYSMTGFGIHGQSAGYGADVLILDDTLKRGSEANSETIRRKLWQDTASAALNRLSPDGIVIAMQARLHKSDLIGMLLEATKNQRSRQFVRIVLAAVNDDGQSSYIEHTATGKREYLPAYPALWPEQYSRAKLDEIRFMGGDFYWNCQYQQRPSLGELAIFNMENLPRYQQPRPIRTWWAWDTANTKEGNSAYSVGVLMAWSEPGNYELLRVVRDRFSFGDLGRTIYYSALDASKHYGHPEAVVIERAASGYGLIDELRSATNLPIVPVVPRGSKFDRAASFSNIVNNGGLAVPEEAPWLDAWMTEMADFPLSDFMDQVDATAHALSYLERSDIFGTTKQSLGIVVVPTDPREMTAEQLDEHLEYLNASRMGDYDDEDLLSSLFRDEW